ncbi:hypothetical protein HWV62_13627 [Athelia sp. TMB]|nr:hypothetical protein HWV62_13627 [Athelia sp. TMB]
MCIQPASIEDLDVPIAQRKAKRDTRKPLSRYTLYLLPQPLPPTTPLPPVDDSPSTEEPPPSSGSLPSPSTEPHHMLTDLHQQYTTGQNMFGLLRKYLAPNPPDHDPELLLELTDLSDEIVDNSDSYHGLTVPNLVPSAPVQSEKYGPYPNHSAFQIGEWYWAQGKKSYDDFLKLVGIISSPEFQPSDVQDVPWKQIDSHLGNTNSEAPAARDWLKISDLNDDHEWLKEDAGWVRKQVKIAVPFHQCAACPGIHDFVAGDLYYRPLVSVIREKLSKAQDSQGFHYAPFEVFWQPGDQTSRTRVYGELYTSPAFVSAHQELQAAPNEVGCNLAKYIVALMAWSDATQLTAFGEAKLWPCYLFFGNESKYRRSKPSNHLCEHIAYFCSLPDSFKDFAVEKMGGRISAKLMTHCRRELFHAQWAILLDDDFLSAYRHGIVTMCPDGTQRRFYPRIFTYSADYPEKVLASSIRDKGAFPCPRCLVSYKDIEKMGTAADMRQRLSSARVDDETTRQKVESARKKIYADGYAVDSEVVEDLLKGQSLTPTARLACYRFNINSALVVDFMHEVELGWWRALFIHLLRILESHDKKLVDELDHRYRQISSFGRDTIRRFSANISELKKLAARDYEDMLQCAIPVFDGLLPEPHNTNILKLLFECAHWHGLAKLRLHIDPTLDLLDSATIRLARQFRAFSRKTCGFFETKELKRELESRKRREAKQKAKQGLSGRSAPARQTADSEDIGPKVKKFNLGIIKYHFIADHVRTIREYGTNDSISTAPVSGMVWVTLYQSLKFAKGELEHRTSKARYLRTSRKGYLRQLAQIERRQARIRAIRAAIDEERAKLLLQEPVPKDPQKHHSIGNSENVYEDIGKLLSTGSGDPALKDFRPKLQEHLLSRILADDDGLNKETTQSSGGRNRIIFKRNRIYRHSLLRVNYTTYDVRRDQDTINGQSLRHNVMVLNCSDNVPSPGVAYRYARVLGTYHANVILSGSRMVDYTGVRMDFLWVRWYEQVDSSKTGWKTQKLDRLRFPPMANQDSFGFLDPADVLHGCHIIPVFAKGKRHSSGKGMSFRAKDSDDWNEYYINRFVDRDMIMRYYFGLSVGHKYSWPEPAVPDSDSADERDEIDQNSPAQSELEEEGDDSEARGDELQQTGDGDKPASDEEFDIEDQDTPSSDDDSDESDDEEFIARCELDL